MPRLAVLAIVLVLFFLLHLGMGGTWLGPLDVLKALFEGDNGERANSVVWHIRLPRAVGCLFVGAMLGIVGASLQGLFRNPLAEPYTVGVSSGATVGAVGAMFLGLDRLWGGLGLMAGAFGTGLLTLALVFWLARRRGAVDVATLLLAGVVIGSLFAAITTLMLNRMGEDANRVLAWMMGSTTPMFWDRIVVMAVATLVGSILLIRQARALNAFAVSERSAQALGVDVGRLKRVVMIAGAAMVSITVGAVGVIGFLGLVAPHIARRVVGVDWRVSMAGALLIGPSLLLFADVLAQRLMRNFELPVGVVTALIGAPFLLLLLKREERL